LHRAEFVRVSLLADLDDRLLVDYAVLALFLRGDREDALGVVGGRGGSGNVLDRDPTRVGIGGFHYPNRTVHGVVADGENLRCRSRGVDVVPVRKAAAGSEALRADHAPGDFDVPRLQMVHRTGGNAVPGPRRLEPAIVITDRPRIKFNDARESDGDLFKGRPRVRKRLGGDHLDHVGTTIDGLRAPPCHVTDPESRPYRRERFRIRPDPEDDPDVRIGPRIRILEHEPVIGRNQGRAIRGHELFDDLARFDRIDPVHSIERDPAPSRWDSSSNDIANRLLLKGTSGAQFPTRDRRSRKGFVHPGNLPELECVRAVCGPALFMLQEGCNWLNDCGEGRPAAGGS
jgi:hypothetical protein